MKVIIKNTYEDMSEWATIYLINKINLCKNKPFILGLPTGSTPLELYNRLIFYYKKGKVSFKNVITFNMDEYVNLEENNNQSYHYFMKTNFFNHIDIPEENINILNGNAENLISECENYEKKIKALGGIDLFIGGVGADGHIAFNEPGSSLSSRTRIKTLCIETIQSNSRFFNDINDVPKMALTVGIGTIMDSKEVMILINGSVKANALQQCLEGSVNNTWTVTALQNHKKTVIVCDNNATIELKKKTIDYYNNLQMQINILGHLNNYDVTKHIKSNETTIIFSPHPDDDVIGIGGLMQELSKSNTYVVYMTSGTGGYDSNEYECNPRIVEATLSLKVLGYKKSQIEFLSLPFYKDSNRKISNSDSEILTTLLEKINPDHIFICADSDPKKTHDKCYEIIRRSKFNKNLKNIWLYYSAWGNWNDICKFSDSVKSKSFRYIFNSQTMNNKVLSIKMHDSQDPPMVFYNDNRPFYEKIIDDNKSPLNPGFYEENFIILDSKEFKNLKKLIQ